MQHQLEGFELTLSINNGASGIPLEAANIVIAENAKNRATVQLAVGNWEKDNSPNAITINRGDTARVLVGYPGLAGNTVIFEGIIFDYAPATNIGEGRVSMTVILYGRLFYLTTGTLHSSMTVPSSYLDADAYWRSATQSTGASERFARITPEDASADFGHAYLDSLIEISTGQYAPVGSVSDFINTTFGSDSNAQATAILEGIEPIYLVFRNFADRENIISGMVTRINDQIQGDWSMASFFDRITALGSYLNYSLVEVGSHIYMVPYSPFFPSSDAKVIDPSSYSEISQGEDTHAALRNYRGVVLTSAGNTARKDDKVVGFYKGSTSIGGLGLGSAIVHGSSALGFEGQVVVAPMPFVYVGTPSKSTDSQNTEARCALDISRDLGNDIAKFMFWQKRYEGRTYYVSCPYLRLDIGPLTPVRVYMPTSNEIQASLESGVIYGMVTSVTIDLNASQGIARTNIEIGYARTKAEQTSVIEPNNPTHPLWIHNWKGSPLSGNRR